MNWTKFIWSVITGIIPVVPEIVRFFKERSDAAKK